MTGPLLNKTKQTQIAQKVRLAHSYWRRLKGLIGLHELPAEESLWLKPCNSIHTFFMKFPIDVVFVDRGLKVMAIKRQVTPWKFVLPVHRADSVFELKSGALNSQIIEVGDQLDVGRSST